MKEALRKQRAQEAFIIFLANKWNLTYEEATKRWARLSYFEFKELFKEYEEGK